MQKRPFINTFSSVRQAPGGRIMSKTKYRRAVLAAASLALASTLRPASALDFYVATAQELQNALTVAAANGANDVIHLTNGYYLGNFNYVSTETNSLVLQTTPGATSADVALDGDGKGRVMSLSSSSNSAFTVRGMTFVRNCGTDGGKAGLRIATGSGYGGNLLVEDCHFVSLPDKNGMGLELVSCSNAVVQRCVVAGVEGGGGSAIIIQAEGAVLIRDSSVTSNHSAVTISRSLEVVLTNNFFSRNRYGAPGTRVDLSKPGASILLARNTFIGDAGSSWTRYPAAYCRVTSGTVTVVNNHFAENVGGGGTQCIGGKVTLSGNTFVRNSASSVPQYHGAEGAGASCIGEFVVAENVFSHNVSLGTSGEVGGAGLYCGGNGTVSSNLFLGNQAVNAQGGALYIGGNSIGCSNNVFTGNQSSREGGAVAADGTLVFANNLLINNQQTNSTSEGGAFCFSGTALEMVNNTIFGNNSKGHGGGAAFLLSGTTETLKVYNNIIWGNSAGGQGGDVYLAGTGKRKEFILNNAHGLSGIWDVAQSNLDVDPQFFDPVNGDYHLRPGSPCVNAGTNGAPGLPELDLDHSPRIVGGKVDLGCYEFTTAVLHPADTNNDWTITEAEFEAYAAAWKSAQGWSVGPVPIPSDYVTRAGYLSGSGGTYHNDGSRRPICWRPGA